MTMSMMKLVVLKLKVIPSCLFCVLVFESGFASEKKMFKFLVAFLDHRRIFSGSELKVQ